MSGFSGWSRSILLGIGVSICLAGCTDVFSRSFVSQEKGMDLYRAGDYETAAASFTDATRQNPRDYKSFFMAGQCYEKIGSEQKAIASYKMSLTVMDTSDVGKQDTEFRNNTIETLASTIARSNSPESEITSLETTAQATNKAYDWLLLARTYVAMGDADNAIDAYNQACIQSPAEIKIVKSYGFYLESLNQPRRAEPYLIRAYQLDPADADVIRALRRVGVVPGPSLLANTDLSRPIVPQGPLPEMKLFPSQTPNQASAGQ